MRENNDLASRSQPCAERGPNPVLTSAQHSDGGETLSDIRLDRAYIAGMKAGYNLGVDENRAELNLRIENTLGEIRYWKSTLPATPDLSGPQRSEAALSEQEAKQNTPSPTTGADQ